MPTYISMLRGINVLGHKRVEMSRLREMCEGMGFEQVRTYIQSGNVVFKTGKSTPSGLSRRIEERMMSEFGFSAMVLTRTAKELGRAIQGNPFVKEGGKDGSKVFVGFLARAPKADAVEKLQARAAKTEQVHCCGREIYVYYVDGMGRARLLTHGVLERVLAVSTTMRNWNTVSKLYQMAMGLDSGNA
ncbi:MAG: DUF1697 domain-containing protein [Terriglobales bacterium]